MSVRETTLAVLAEEILQRCRFTRAEDARKLASLANAERQFGREYHGRFVIELLQNAADAWRKIAAADERSKVQIILDQGPSLIVANQGEVLTAETIIKSLGHIGATTKPIGEAIGHKGIGFKSVLEMTLSPEVYSGFSDDDFEVAVRFDPQRALEQIRACSPGWDDFLAEVTGLPDDPLAPIPILQFPFPIERIPEGVLHLGRAGFTTVVRLTFDPANRTRLRLDAAAWEAAARAALHDVTDEIVLLLDTFDDVVLEDRLEDEIVHITHSAEDEPSVLEDNLRATQVVMRRNGEASSRWRVYRETLPYSSLLEGEIVAGVPLALDGIAPQSIATGVPSAPFHLFFPTRIASGLPFLLHGYFEVAAGRASFYGGSEQRNRSLLERLSKLVARAVTDTAAQGVSLGPLAHLLQQASMPEDHLAAWFQDETIRALDEVAWIPTQPSQAVPSLVTPLQALAFPNALVTSLLSKAFDPAYVWDKTSAAPVDRTVDEPGLTFLAQRRAHHDPPLPDLWAALRLLLMPGEHSPWPQGSEDQGFVALLKLVAVLQGNDSYRARTLISALRGNDLARVIPVVAAGDTRELVPPPSPPTPGGGARSQLILARLREREAGELVPPPELQVSFVRDQLLDARLLSGAASDFGVQEYVVDSILDRLDGLELDEKSSHSIVEFVWRLLVREERSAFGLRRTLRDMPSFEPGQWFWFQPGRADGAEADRQRREHGLASLLLPSRSNTWMPASRLAFGADWADWLESGAAGPLTSAGRARTEAYRDLEQLAPSPDRLLAAPEQVGRLLPDVPIWAEDWPEELTGEARIGMLRHGYLLRLGVWEIPPIEVFSDRRDRANDRIPWPGPLRDLLLRSVRERGGWRFGYAEYEHQNVTIGEDYRFEWPFEGCDPEHLARSISRASRLCERLAYLYASCPSCRTHRTRYTTTHSNTQFPSRLALQLKTGAWLPCVKDGQDIDQPLHPAEAWWEPSLPERANIKQSPLRYLSIVRPGTPLPQELIQLAGLPQLSSAGIRRISELLAGLRDGYLEENLAPDPRSSKLAKQAFVGLHRLAYERLAVISARSPDQVDAALDNSGVLCDIAGELEYRPLEQAWHDDGRFSAYRRYFAAIPFAIIPKENNTIARRLSIQPFEINFVRRNHGAGTDVTDEIAPIFGDRVAEFLAIVVNHSLGTQTLEIGSEQFQERARRLQRLRVVRIDELILDAQVVGTDIRASIGEQAGFDVFLHGPTTQQPVLYHNIRENGWKERLRGKLGENVAALLENPAYSATFTLFLQKDSDADREDFLLELGVTPDDVDAVRLALGIVSEADRTRHRVWYQAICDAAGHPLDDPDASEDEETNLLAAGLPPETVRRLLELGGGADVRTNVGPDGALRLLVNARISLERLHRALLEHGDAGLVIRTGTDALRSWRARYGRYVAAVLETKIPAADAKKRVDSWSLDPTLRLTLDPEATAVIRPVIEDLRSVGVHPDADSLAGEDPIAELTRLAGCQSTAELEHRVVALFDAEERGRILRGLARDWRRQLRLIGVLVRAVPHEPRAVTRLHAEEVDRLLPANPDRPSDLRSQLLPLLPAAPGLTASLSALLLDEVTASPPDRRGIAAILQEHGLEPARLEEIERVLAMPAKTEARRLRAQIDQLSTHSIDVSPPKTRTTPPPAPKRSSVVRTIRVGGGDQRRQQVGAEGERWALAAIIKPLLSLDARKRAIPAITELLRTFEGEAVQRALAHEDAVMASDLDEEDLIDELTGLLHVAKYSDAFGFDLLGWLPPAEGAQPAAMCLEAKSSSDGKFHLSAAEWGRAAGFRDDGRGEQYAVLVVRRHSGAAPVPERLDLLVDPVSQCEQGLLSRQDDGYIITY